MVYLPNGSFTDPEPLTTSLYDDTQLSVDRNGFYDANITDLNNLAWISDAKKVETKSRRIEKAVEMLEKGKKSLM